MVFVKHNSLKSDIFFNLIFIPDFSGSRFFRAQVFEGPGFPGSRFFRVQGPGSRVRVQGPRPGSRVRVQGPGASPGSGPGSVSGSRVWVQVLEVANSFLFLYVFKEGFKEKIVIKKLYRRLAITIKGRY